MKVFLKLKGVDIIFFELVSVGEKIIGGEY